MKTIDEWDSQDEEEYLTFTAALKKAPEATDPSTTISVAKKKSMAPLPTLTHFMEMAKSQALSTSPLTVTTAEAPKPISSPDTWIPKTKKALLTHKYWEKNASEALHHELDALISEHQLTDLTHAHQALLDLTKDPALGEPQRQWLIRTIWQFQAKLRILYLDGHVELEHQRRSPSAPEKRVFHYELLTPIDQKAFSRRFGDFLDPHALNISKETSSSLSQIHAPPLLQNYMHDVQDKFITVQNASQTLPKHPFQPSFMAWTVDCLQDPLRSTFFLEGLSDYLKYTHACGHTDIRVAHPIATVGHPAKGFEPFKDGSRPQKCNAFDVLTWAHLHAHMTPEQQQTLLHKMVEGLSYRPQQTLVPLTAFCLREQHKSTFNDFHLTSFCQFLTQHLLGTLHAQGTLHAFFEAWMAPQSHSFEGLFKSKSPHAFHWVDHVAMLFQSPDHLPDLFDSPVMQRFVQTCIDPPNSAEYTETMPAPRLFLLSLLQTLMPEQPGLSILEQLFKVPGFISKFHQDLTLANSSSLYNTWFRATLFNQRALETLIEYRQDQYLRISQPQHTSAFSDFSEAQEFDHTQTPEGIQQALLTLLRSGTPAVTAHQFNLPMMARDFYAHVLTDWIQKMPEWLQQKNEKTGKTLLESFSGLLGTKRYSEVQAAYLEHQLTPHDSSMTTAPKPKRL